MVIGIKRLLETLKIMEKMINYGILERSTRVVSGCLLYRNKRMRTKDFTYGLLGFVVVYLAIQLVLAYFGGYL